MNEPWLRSNQGNYLNAPQNHNVYNLTVQQLLLPNLKQWDVVKVNSLFSVDVAKSITSVPLVELVREDKLIWSEEKDGIYSVRTGYRRLMRERNKGYMQRCDEGWSCIWKIHAPPKAKHLLWRICKECLPTRVRLRNRFVQCPEDCPLCLSHVEEDWHLFFNCEAIREAWHVMELSHIVQPRLHIFNNPRDLIFDICRKESNMDASKVAVLLWFIWQNRNNYVWNDSKSSAQQVGMQAAHYWYQWATINGLLQDHQQLDQQQPVDNTLVQWQQPALGFLKCNVDASFFNTVGASGWGWCLRDWRGQFKLAGSNFVKSSLSIMEGEAMAVIEAMEEMMERGISFVTFESDSKLVVDAISSKQVGLSEFSTLIAHIQNLLRMNNYFEVKYVKRQANKVAHSLARAAFSMSRRCIFDSVPRCIETQLINEMS
ncbi:hypothetical protein QL285_048880 [Trifolium repens]|nr:hypothetical protein QL285_048880 [Trifolium repens]